MIVAGGSHEHRWLVASTDHHSATGRVLRRDITITIADQQLVLTATDAKRLASAILLTTKHGDPA